MFFTLSNIQKDDLNVKYISFYIKTNDVKTMVYILENNHQTKATKTTTQEVLNKQTVTLQSQNVRNIKFK